MIPQEIAAPVKTVVQDFYELLNPALSGTEFRLPPE